MKLGFFSSKCTCMSMMRFLGMADAICSDRDVAEGSALAKLHAPGTLAAAAPKNLRRDTWVLISFPPTQKFGRPAHVVMRRADFRAMLPPFCAP